MSDVLPDRFTEGPAPDRATDRSLESDARAITYGRYYYAHDCGIPYERNDHWLGFFGKIADRIVHDLQPSSVLDAGCAMGLLVEQLVRRGVDAHGIDISEFAISQVHKSVSDRCRVGSLTEPIDGRYDLVVCIEVLEHMLPDDAKASLANIAAVSDHLLLSSSPVDYGEPTHVNVRPPEAWSADLATHGLLRNLNYDASYVAPWTVLYERRPADAGTVVREYDRAFWRMRDEILQLRDSVLTLHERLESSDFDPARVEERAEAQREERAQAQRELDARNQTIFQLREQVLAMRDTIIGFETAKGDIAAEREWYQAHRDTGAAQQLKEVLESRTWRATWKLMAPYRRARRMLGP